MDKKLSVPARVVVKAHIAFGIVAIFQQKLKRLVQVKRFFRLVGYGPQPCRSRSHVRSYQDGYNWRVSFFLAECCFYVV